MGAYSYEIGSSLAGMVNVENLSTPLPAPKSMEFYQPYTQYIPAGDGTVFGAGWAVTEWHWGYVTKAQYEQLKTFCSGASSEVYIKTRKNDGTYATYKAVMVWPQTHNIQGDIYLEFTLKFQRLEAQE